jgi:hypothetical protein
LRFVTGAGCGQVGVVVDRFVVTLTRPFWLDNGAGVSSAIALVAQDTAIASDSLRSMSDP